MKIVHLTASTYYGGPERQMLELAASLPPEYATTFLLFTEKGRYRPFLEQVRRWGFEGRRLAHDTPRLLGAVLELRREFARRRPDVLCCHGYKANLLGQAAARLAGVPVVSVSRGWTGENLRVRLYECLDRLALRRADCVVCVSEGQAAKVRRAGVPAERIVVIHNAIRAGRFGEPDPDARPALLGLFPAGRPRCLVLAAGRLSPEKGFDCLVEAARQATAENSEIGFVVFGDGPLRESLARQVELAGLAGRFVLAGFRADLDRLLPAADLFVLPSYTEGLPNVVLEAMAAGLPVVATAVGGTPELVEEGVTGHLVPAGDADALAQRVLRVLRSADGGRALGEAGRLRVRRHFTFEAQGEAYRCLFRAVVQGRPAAGELFPARA